MVVWKIESASVPGGVRSTVCSGLNEEFEPLAALCLRRDLNIATVKIDRADEAPVLIDRALCCKALGAKTSQSHEGDNFAALPLPWDHPLKAKPDGIPKRPPHFSHRKRREFCLESEFRRHRLSMHGPDGDFNWCFRQIDKPFNAFQGLADAALCEKRMFEHAKAAKLICRLSLSSSIVAWLATRHARAT